MDNLRDLFWLSTNTKRAPDVKPPPLQPMKDKDTGIVSIKGSIVRTFTSANAMLDAVDDAEVLYN